MSPTVRSPLNTAVSPWISPAACSATSPSRSLISTCAPCSASSSAVARPMPRADPVTMADLPSSTPTLISPWSARKNSRETFGEVYKSAYGSSSARPHVVPARWRCSRPPRLTPHEPPPRPSPRRSRRASSSNGPERATAGGQDPRVHREDPPLRPVGLARGRRASATCSHRRGRSPSRRAARAGSRSPPRKVPAKVKKDLKFKEPGSDVRVAGEVDDHFDPAGRGATPGWSADLRPGQRPAFSIQQAREDRGNGFREAKAIGGTVVAIYRNRGTELAYESGAPADASQRRRASSSVTP